MNNIDGFRISTGSFENFSSMSVMCIADFPNFEVYKDMSFEIFKILDISLTDKEIEEIIYDSYYFDEEKSIHPVSDNLSMIFSKRKSGSPILHVKRTIEQEDLDNGKYILFNKNLSDINGYNHLKYKNIIKAKNEILGIKHFFEGEVLQYEETNIPAFGIVKRDGDPQQLYQVYFPVLSNNRLVIGDKVRIYGVLTGLSLYKNSVGNEKLTPLILADFVEIEGIDY